MITRSLVCLAASLLLASAHAADEDGFVPMFNGKDLSSWEGSPGWWLASNGILTAESTPEKPCKGSHYLYWKGGEPPDFDLRCSWRLTGNANSGVQFRSDTRPNWDTWGFQADMDSAGAYVGALYHHARGLVAQRGEKVVIDESGKKTVTKFAESEALLKIIKKGEWNTYRVLADGPKMTLWINDVLMCEAEVHDAKMKAPKNVISLQMHQGPPMKAEFKDLRIRVSK